MKYDCRNLDVLRYSAIEILGVKGLFTDFRIDRATLPEGIYAYSIRHSDGSDDDDEWFDTIEPNVFVNHLGDFITDKNLEEMGLNESNGYYREINGDYSFTNEDEQELLIKFNII